MRITRFFFAAPIALLPLVALAGCSGQDDHLAVRGSALVTTGTAATGFSFVTDTRLDEDRVATSDGRIVGHCTIQKSASGIHTLDVSLSRPGAPSTGGLAIRSFKLHVDDTREPAHGTVTAELGDVTFSGTSSASCTVGVTYLDASQGIAGVTATCDLAGSDGSTATSTAELEWSGCENR